jgi:hypothetical protein
MIYEHTATVEAEDVRRLCSSAFNGRLSAIRLDRPCRGTRLFFRLSYREMPDRVRSPAPDPAIDGVEGGNACGVEPEIAAAAAPDQLVIRGRVAERRAEGDHGRQQQKSDPGFHGAGGYPSPFHIWARRAADSHALRAALLRFSPRFYFPLL